MLRQEYFSGLSRAEWEAKVGAALEAVTLNPADVLNKFPTSSQAASNSGFSWPGPCYWT